jgi:hypothetical protein
VSEPLILPSQEIWSRYDFPLLATWRRLYRVAEVGVDRGEFSINFLDRWLGDHYYGIDHYRPTPDFPHDRTADFHAACIRYERHARRAKLIKGESVETASIFKPDSLDFVYIDGNHDLESVLTDLNAWWHTISDEGIIAGHDFDETHPGVIEAVTLFAEQIEQPIYLTNVEGFVQETEPSWYMYRNGMPGADWRRC